MKFSVREFNTVLAALRCYQQQMEMNGGLPPRDFQDIAMDGGDDYLDTEEIDALCERINS